MKNWIWTHFGAQDRRADWKPRFDRIRSAGLEAVVACIYTGHEALYGSHHLPVAAPQLEWLVPLAAASGLELHAWIVTLRCNVPGVQQAHPEWYSVSRKGASSLAHPPYIPSYQWLCPAQPEVRAFVREIVSELAAYDALPGIHLDYIRHPDVILPVALQPRYGLVQDQEFPEFDFCYCDYCRQTFRAQTGIDPLTVADPATHPAWVAYRWESVQGVVAEAAAVTWAAGKVLTAAVFATPMLARAYVRQDWPSWELDGVLPMIYHYYYGQPVTWIGEATGEGVEALAGRRPLYAGLFIPQLKPEELGPVVADVRAAGAAGIALFSWGAMTDAHWETLGPALAAG
jgi:uncharacterized lipoprotein YddW (UPF0748 family)